MVTRAFFLLAASIALLSCTSLTDQNTDAVLNFDNIDRICDSKNTAVVEINDITRLDEVDIDCNGKILGVVNNSNWVAAVGLGAAAGGLLGVLSSDMQKARGGGQIVGAMLLGSKGLSEIWIDEHGLSVLAVAPNSIIEHNDEGGYSRKNGEKRLLSDLIVFENGADDAATLKIDSLYISTKDFVNGSIAVDNRKYERKEGRILLASSMLKGFFLRKEFLCLFGHCQTVPKYTWIKKELARQTTISL